MCIFISIYLYNTSLCNIFGLLVGKELKVEMYKLFLILPA